MHPAFSVIFLTTLIGAGQGLFLALYSVQVYSSIQLLPVQNGHDFYAYGSFVGLSLLAVGLAASFLHLGHPERAWRAMTQWRTSWLSREVIVLPVFMLVVFMYGIAHFVGWNPNLFGDQAHKLGEVTFFIGAVGTLICFLLFISTGMIYGCLKFLQEWHTPLTPINFTLLGTCSGFTLAAAYSSINTPGLVGFFSILAVVLTLLALVFRLTTLMRNRKLKHRSSLRTAIGVRHQKIKQISQGSMGGSFNTREFFHNKSPSMLRFIKWFFVVAAFIMPIALILIALYTEQFQLLILAFIIQYLGLIAERWFFFAQANHPQNLYYQAI